MSKKPTLLERTDPSPSIPGGRGRNRLASFAAQNSRLARYSALELNADMRPIWYYPLSTINWADVIWLIAKGEQTGIPRIHVVDVYPGVYVRTGTRQFELPSVVSHLKMRPWPRRVPRTRYNLYVRDNFTCQYTGVKLPLDQLNFDHVIPKSQGGKDTWENLVACDRRINTLKRNQTPREAGLKLIREPYEPTPQKMYDLGRMYPPRFLHTRWEDFLFWNPKAEPIYTSPDIELAAD